MSETTSDVDEEFKVKKDEKFEFINEGVENWPQWSVDEPKTKKDKTGDEEVQQIADKLK